MFRSLCFLLLQCFGNTGILIMALLNFGWEKRGKRRPLVGLPCWEASDSQRAISRLLFASSPLFSFHALLSHFLCFCPWIVPGLNLAGAFGAVTVVLREKGRPPRLRCSQFCFLCTHFTAGREQKAASCPKLGLLGSSSCYRRVKHKWENQTYSFRPRLFWRVRGDSVKGSVFSWASVRLPPLVPNQTFP